MFIRNSDGLRERKCSRTVGTVVNGTTFSSVMYGTKTVPEWIDRESTLKRNGTNAYADRIRCYGKCRLHIDVRHRNQGTRCGEGNMESEESIVYKEVGGRGVEGGNVNSTVTEEIENMLVKRQWIIEECISKIINNRRRDQRKEGNIWKKKVPKRRSRIRSEGSRKSLLCLMIIKRLQ